MTTDFRSLFPVTRQWSFLNHAAVAPLSQPARDMLVAYADDMTENGNVHERDWWGLVETARHAAARMLCARVDEVAWVKNTSEGLAYVAEGFPWKTGDNLVIPAGEYPANVYPWLHLADKGVEVRIVPCRGTRIERDDLKKAIDSRTRLLSISHVQFATGFRSDLAAIGEMCRARGVDFCVDAIQGLGCVPIDVAAMHIDYLAADGHKWLVGPEGAGVFFIRTDRIERIRPVSIGWKSVVNYNDFSTIDFRLRQGATRYEGGTFNIPGLVALGASLKLLEEIGITTVMRQVKDLTDYLVERLSASGAEVASSRHADEWSGIVSFSKPGLDPRDAVPRILERKVVIAHRAGFFRASPHFYNNKDDIDRLIGALAEIRQ